jgi:chromate transporter
MTDPFRECWKEIAAVFLKLGAISYGGGAMMGIMHAEIAEKRGWLTNERYLDGIALVSMLPGPPAVQLAIFVGYDRAGWRGGVLAGLCFMLPAFFILLGLTLLYSAYGTVDVVRDALHGIGAVVLGIFAAAVYRLGKSALNGPAPIAIAVVAAILAAITPVGIATILLLAACAGVALYDSRVHGLVAAMAVVALAASIQLLLPLVMGSVSQPDAPAPGGAVSPSLWQLAALFLKVSALTFGGGIAILAFVQEHVVNQMHWLTPREFLDGLALGQLTPGPTLMIAAYVGYKVAGLSGSLVSALCIFAPAFFLLLPLLPVLERFEHLLWIKAAMRGINPAVIGCLVVTLAQLLPHAAPDSFGVVLLALTALALVFWRIAPLPLILGAGLLGVAVRFRPF